ncbi:MAG: hypothetical protein A2W08_02220 [Candidatus Rokubacteria bacterium RBG_16_73_20]|nr:MAG: hypothetical protein A2050_02655 [Candidatus Rokubacteria bacterium GWA2_73_35]OGK97814.1 MAG: hypothetical protein A2W08_02220 [Candidatus Rokubacteria bacterium RBG_16_73_20]
MPDPSVRFKGTYREEGWRRCGQMSAADGLRFTPWPHERFPGWSLPALEAAKCVAKQDEAAYARLHLRLYEAFFGESQDIADPAVVAALVAEAGADMDRFRLDLEAGLGRQAVGADYEAAVAEHGVRAIPTVIVLETGRVFEGLAPADAYRAAVEDALA